MKTKPKQESRVGKGVMTMDAKEYYDYVKLKGIHRSILLRSELM